MEKFKKILTWFGLDGAQHLCFSALLTVLLGAIIPLWIAVLVVAAIGLAKELVYDLWMKLGTFDVKDIICDIAGIVIGAVCVALTSII